MPDVFGGAPGKATDLPSQPIMDALVSDFVRRAAALPPRTDYDSLTAKYKLQRRKQLEMVAGTVAEACEVLCQ